MPCSQSVFTSICVHERVSVCLTVNRKIKKSFRRESRNSYYGSRAYIQYLNCEKRSGGTLEARRRRRRYERRRRENRGAKGAEGDGNGEGVSPSPTDYSGGAS